MNDKNLIGDTIGDLRRSWKSLVLTDLVYKAIAFALLTPLVTLPLRVMFAFSNDTILADQDILFFFLSPFGLICLVVMGIVWVSILALELTALLAILANPGGDRLSTVGAISFAYVNKMPVIGVTCRTVVFLMVNSAPFVAALGLTYVSLLSEYDINFYLNERPPAFQLAAGLGIVIGIAWAAVLIRLSTCWFFALPLVLFENTNPANALRESSRRSKGHRRKISLWIVIWLAVVFIVSAMATGLVVGLARWIIPGLQGSLSLLTIAIGIALLCWMIANMFVNLATQAAFVALYFNLYKRFARDASVSSIHADAEKPGRQSSGIRFTGRRLAMGTIVSLIAAILLATWMFNGIRTDTDVDIIAHRGASGAAPENTMAAIRLAIKQGADWVEIDVQETADNRVVVLHDSDFMKLAGNPLKIWDATMDDLKNIDIGSWFGPEFKDERVPTLETVLLECKGKVGVYIELKYYGHDIDLENRVARIVDSLDMSSDVAIISLKLDAIDKMKALRPEWKTGLLMSVSAGNLGKIHADFLAVNASFADRAFIQTAHRNGKTVSAWTVNDAATMHMIIGQGIDGIITDEPAMGRSVVEQRAKMKPAQRLLIALAEIFGIQAEFEDQ